MVLNKVIINQLNEAIKVFISKNFWSEIIQIIFPFIIDLMIVLNTKQALNRNENVVLINSVSLFGLENLDCLALI